MPHTTKTPAARAAPAAARCPVVIELYDPDPAGELAFDVVAVPEDLRSLRRAIDGLPLPLPAVGNVLRFAGRRYFISREALVSVGEGYRPSLGEILAGLPLP